jgi:ATP synthase F1 delta subunit
MESGTSYNFALAMFRLLKQPGGFTPDDFEQSSAQTQEFLGANSKAMHFLAHPAVPASAKEKLINLITENKTELSVLRSLIALKKIHILNDVYMHLRNMISGQADTVKAELQVPVMPGKEEKELLKQSLEKAVNKKVRVRITERPGLISGIRLKMGGMVIDNSLKMKLKIITEGLLQK